MHKKIMSILLSFSMLLCAFCVLPTNAFASNVAEGSLDSIYNDFSLYSQAVESSQGSITSEKLYSSYYFDNKSYEGDIVEIEKSLRDVFVSRDDSFTFTLASTDSTYTNNNVFAIENTKQFMENLVMNACSDELSMTVHDGDYLMWNFAGIKSYQISKDGWLGGVFFYTFYLDGISYYTTAAEEAKVDNWVNTYFSSFNMYDYTDYQLVKKFHDDICNMTVYDYDYDTRNDNYDFSAYGVFCEGRAVCQGYAVAFYRLCKEAGVSCRFVSSGEDGNHAWNLVSMGGTYYYVDCTWDDNDDGKSFTYNYFLKDSDEIISKDGSTNAHKLDTIYDTDYYNNNFGKYTSKTSYVNGCDNLCNATSYLSKTVYNYSGNANCPIAYTSINGNALTTTYSYTNNVDTGVAYVRIYGTGNYDGMWIQRRFDVKLGDISSFSASLSATSYVYDGTEKRPTVYINGLTNGVDYNVLYSSNIYPGVGYVTITGCNNSFGSQVLQFDILPCDISNLSASLSATSYVYDGTEKRPTVYINGLTNGVDYNVSYSSNINTGVGYATVTGCNTCLGSQTLSFNIVPCGVSSLKASSSTTSSVKLSWSATSANQYVISQKKSGAWVDIMTVAGDLTSCKVTSLNSATSYEFAIRAYNNNTGYGDMSSTVVICTNPKKTTIKSKSTKKKSITVKWAKVKCSGYQIQYSTLKKFTKKTTKTVKISGQSKVSKKISKLKKGKKYYIKVRAYKTYTLKSGSKKTCYGAWSSVKNIKCK